MNWRFPLRFSRTYCRQQPLHVRPFATANFDVAVVGVGAMGSAAAFHAARAGLKVLGLEQYKVGNQFGSSHGQTRIFRVAHYGTDNLPRLATRSGKLWEELQEDSHRRVLFRCGNLNLGGDYVNAVKENCDALSLPYELLNPQELQEMYPGFKLPEDGDVALLDPLGGFLDSDLILQTHVELTRKMNGVISEGEVVKSWRPDGAGVRIETNRNVYLAQKLILSTGPWITTTLPESKDTLQVERQVIGWYTSKPADLFTPEKLPAFIGFDKAGTAYYGIPSYQNHGMKIAKYNHLKEVMEINKMDYSVHQKDKEVLENTLKLYFRQEEHTLQDSAVCVFTNTPDEEFLIDQHPIYPQILICSACSGAGFKYSAVIGQILTEMAIEDLSKDSIELLAPYRISRQSLDLQKHFKE